MTPGRSLHIILPALLLAVFAGAAQAQSIVGVLGIDREVAPIEARLEGSREVAVRGYVFRVGTLTGRQVVVGRTAAGKVNAAIVATVLIGHFNPSALFFSGTAGAIDQGLRQGDVVLGTGVVQHDVGVLTGTGITRRGLRNSVTGEMDPLIVAPPETLLAVARRAVEGLTLTRIEEAGGTRLPRIVEGVIVTGDVFLSDAARRDEMRASLGASAVEMEGAAMVQACRQFSVPCLVVRSITDRADGQAMSNYKQFIATASENAAAVVAAIIARLPATSPASGPWLQYGDVRQAGFDEQALRAVCERADSLRSGAVMAIFKGHVILACGDLERPFEAHSVRKSLVSGLYGIAVAKREIDLDATLASFAIDEPTPLTASERSATIRQVISARSGVYLPAAYAPASQERRPARGSHPPGTHWFYNNWDFNIAGVIYEQATREDLYESFDRRIARPLGMEDWDPADGFRVYEPTKSRQPAHTFRISARDLARFGQLYLQEGRWEERQLLPADWVKESTRPHTDDGDGTGYGYMWWTYQRGSEFTAKYPALGRHTFFRALGTGEQGLWVIRDADLVVVHRADTDNGRTVTSEDHWKLVESILAARRGEPRPNPELRPLTAAPLPSQLPPAPIPQYRALSRSALDDYLGEYKLSPGTAQLAGRMLTPGGTARVFLFDDKPYLHLPGAGDVMLFPTGRDAFTIRAAPGLAIAFERDAKEKVSAVLLTLGGRSLKGLSAPAP